MAFWILGMGTGIKNHIPAFWEWERNEKIDYKKFAGINGDGWEFHKKIPLILASQCNVACKIKKFVLIVF